MCYACMILNPTISFRRQCPCPSCWQINTIILATTFCLKNANSCELPMKLQAFYCGPYRPSCRYSLQSFTSSHHYCQKVSFGAHTIAIPKPTTTFRRQCPCPPSWRLLSKSDNSSHNFLPENRKLVWAPYEATVILFRMMSFHRQCPCPPSCAFS